jgi:DNA-binding winged helix-turn-helix (wHTH) protein
VIERFNFEKFSLSPRERRLYASDGRLIPLSARAFDTLLLLVQRTNELIDRQTFMRTLWPDLTVEPNNLDQNISIVRRALGEKPGEHRFIVTVPGRGFRFVPMVTRVASAETSHAEALPVPLMPPAGTRDVEAYRAYVQARAILNLDSARNEKAFVLFDEAVARDPSFALALAWRARAKAALLPKSPPIEEIERDVRRALALDPNLAEAHATLAAFRAQRGDWLGAEESFQAALRADPSEPIARMQYVTRVLMPVGRLAESRAQLMQAYRLAPADVFVVSQLAALNSILGLDDEAIRFHKLATALGAGPFLPEVYANAALRAGRHAEAATHMAANLSPAMKNAGGAEVMKLVCNALADPLLKSAARDALTRLTQALSVGQSLEPFIATDIITAFARLGALEPAYHVAEDLLKDAERQGAVGLGQWVVVWLPEMSAFRLDVRFQSLARRLRLFDYWERYGPADGCWLRDGQLVG